MALSDIELYESLLARDTADRRFRFHAGMLLLATSLLTVSRFIFGRGKTDPLTEPSRGLIEEPVVMITLVGWGVGVLLQFLESHKRIDRQIGK
jgi:hypothetical protein